MGNPEDKFKHARRRKRMILDKYKHKKNGRQIEPYDRKKVKIEDE